MLIYAFLFQNAMLKLWRTRFCPAVTRGHNGWFRFSGVAHDMANAGNASSTGREMSDEMENENLDGSTWQYDERSPRTFDEGRIKSLYWKRWDGIVREGVANEMGGRAASRKDRQRVSRVQVKEGPRAPPLGLQTEDSGLRLCVRRRDLTRTEKLLLCQ
jgi:hypothetical protein